MIPRKILLKAKSSSPLGNALGLGKPKKLKDPTLVFGLTRPDLR